MYPHDGRVDHLDGGIMSGSKRVHEPPPYASSPPADEAVIAGSIWAITFRQITPWRARSQHPKDAVEDTSILLNLIYDFAQTGLPLDNVDPEAIERPIHWDIRLIERFMIIMGPTSSMFDILTISSLLLLFQADVAFFRTGWFMETLSLL